MTNNHNIGFQFSPVLTKRASEAIYEQIRERILNGEITPGDRLPSERTLMEMFERSRPTIREALRMLERSGLIKTIPGSSGAVVMKLSNLSVEQPLQNIITLNQISKRELIEYRELNETAFAGWAAKRRTDEDIRQIEDCITRAEGSMGDFVKFIYYDIELHEKIVFAAHNRIASIVDNVVHRLVNNILITEYSSRPEENRRYMCEEILQMHKLLFEAIQKQDSDLAMEYMKYHLKRFQGDLNL